MPCGCNKKKIIHYDLTDGAPTPPTCLTGMHFDGSSYISLNQQTAAMGVMMWIRISSDRQSDLWKNRILGGSGWHVNLTNNKFNFHIDGVGDYINSSVLQQDKWYYFGFRWEDDLVRLTVGDDQGNIVETLNGTVADFGTVEDWGIVNIGHHLGWSFLGDMDEIRVFSDTPALLDTYMDDNFYQKYPVEAGLTSSIFADITFDDLENGDTSVDSEQGFGPASFSIVGSATTVSGPPPYCGIEAPDPPTPDFPCGKSMVFNGTTEAANPTNAINIGATGTLQMAVNFKRSANKEKDILFAGANWTLQRKSDGKLAFNYAGSELAVSSSAIAENTIKWLSMYYSGGNITLKDGTTTIGTGTYTPPSNGATKALVLDGSHLLKYGTPVSLGTTFTIEWWYVFGNTSTAPICFFSDSTGGFSIIQSANNFIVYHNGLSALIHSFRPGAGIATHYAVSVNGNTVKLYINGAIVDTDTAGGTVTGEVKYIGHHASNLNYNPEGTIDDIRLWNDVRTDQEISDNYAEELTTTPANLLANFIISDSDSGNTELIDAVAASNIDFYSIDASQVQTLDTVTLIAGIAGASDNNPTSFNLTLNYIGNDGNGNHLEATADEIRVFNADESGDLRINETIANPSGVSSLQLYYRFDSSTEGEPLSLDESVNNNHSTVGTNSITLVNGFVCDDGTDPPDPPSPGLELIVGGEKKRWHKVWVKIEGEDASETAATYKDYRCQVVFVHQGTSTQYVVRAHFAADFTASETSSTTGKYWRAYFVPDLVGTWTATVHFRKGTNIALSKVGNEGDAMPIDGQSASFIISESDKSGYDLRYHGRDYPVAGKFFRQYACSKRYRMRAAIGWPENFLAYHEFDNTQDFGGLDTPGLIDGLHQYGPHVGYWNSGDPTWQNGKGKGIIGLLNYVGQYMNGIYVIMHTTDGGDGMDTYPWTGPSSYDTYDISKLDQWEIALNHCVKNGIHPQLFFHEVENQSAITGGINDEEKLYIYEMVSRFGHVWPTWNLGEECSLGVDAKKDRFKELMYVDPYNSERTFHTQVFSAEGFGTYDQFYIKHVENGEEVQLMTSTSIQNHINQFFDDAKFIRIKTDGIQGNTYLPVYHDEQTTPVSPTNGNLYDMRKAFLDNMMGGGAGVSYWGGYQGTFGDVQSEDFTIVQPLLAQSRRIFNFFQLYTPFWNLELFTNAIGNVKVRAIPGTIYVGWRQSGDVSIDFSTHTQEFPIWWFNPAEGGGLQQGTVASISGGGAKSIGQPPSNTGSDWLFIVGEPYTHVEGTCPDSGDEGNCEADFGEVNGIVTVNASSLARNGLNWNKYTDINGYAAPDGYLKYEGSSYPNTPGNEEMTFTVKFHNTGTYRVQFHHAIAEGVSNTDSNDVWFKADGLYLYATNGTTIYTPHGEPGNNPQGPGANGYFKLFFNFLNGFYWLTQTSDNEIDYWIYFDVDTPGTYTFRISGRSTGYALDRMTFWNLGLTTEDVATNLNNQETPCSPPPSVPTNGKYVVHINVSGLRSDILEAIDSDTGIFKLMNEGVYTLNARPDFDNTLTIPNVVSQLVGKPVLGTLGHQYFQDSHTTGSTVSSESIFTLLNEENFKTALFSSHTNVYNLLDESYGSIEIKKLTSSDSLLLTEVQNTLPSELPVYSFIHFKSVDEIGRSSGFSGTVGSDYSNMVLSVSSFIDSIVTLIQNNATLKDNTYVILTTDHGGEGFSSDSQIQPNIFKIPFIVWGSDISPIDLYSINQGVRTDPGDNRLLFNNDDTLQPVLNADAANVAASLLGINRSITGSVVNENFSLRLKGVTPPTPGTPPGEVDVASFIGTNFVMDAIQKDLEKLSFQPARGYWHGMDFTKINSPNQLFTDPILGFGGAYSMGSYLRTLKTEGSERTIICLKGNPAFASGLTENVNAQDGSFNFSGPSAQGGPTYNPNSYTAHANYVKMWAEYLVPFENEHSVEYIALLNEPKEHWKTPDGRTFFYQAPSGYTISESVALGDWRPEEEFAYAKAAYDATRDVLGNSNIKIATGGMVAWDPVEFERGYDWCVDWNNGEPPFDALCIHIYWNAQLAETKYYKHGVSWSIGEGASPEEAGGLRNFMQEAVDLIRSKGGRWAEIEILITETGYDINPGSPHNAEVTGKSGQESQAILLSRKYLAYTAVSGLNGVYQYFFAHTHSDGLNDGSVFASSGLLSNPGNNSYDPPMISWYYHAQIRNILRDTFLTEYTHGNDAYTYRYDGDGKTIFAVWSPTRNGTTVSNFSLTTGGSGTAKQYTMSKTSETPSQSDLVISGGAVTIPQVTETITFIEIPNANSASRNSQGTGAIGTTYEIG